MGQRSLIPLTEEKKNPKAMVLWGEKNIGRKSLFGQMNLSEGQSEGESRDGTRPRLLQEVVMLSRSRLYQGYQYQSTEMQLE